MLYLYKRIGEVFMKKTKIIKVVILGFFILIGIVGFIGINNNKKVLNRQVHKLVINYVYENGKEASKSVEKIIQYDTDYEIISPVIDKYTADKPIVAGTMPNTKLEITVTYKLRKNLILSTSKVGDLIDLDRYGKEELGNVYKIEQNNLIYIVSKSGIIIEIGTDVITYSKYFEGYYAIKKKDENIYTLYYNDEFITNNQTGNTYIGKNSDRYVYFPIIDTDEIYPVRISDENSSPCGPVGKTSTHYYYKVNNSFILWNSLNGKKMSTTSNQIENFYCGEDCEYNQDIVIYSDEKMDDVVLYDSDTLQRIFKYSINTYQYYFSKSVDNNEYFSFCENGKCGVGDKNSNLLIPMEYSSTFVLKNNLIIVSNGELTKRQAFSATLNNRSKRDGSLFGIVNLDNEVIIPTIYEELEIFDLENYIIAKKDGKYGVINYENEVVIDFQYDELKSYAYLLATENYFFINDDIYDLKTKEKIAQNFEGFYYTKNYLTYSINEKIMIYSTKEHKEVIPKNMELKGTIDVGILLGGFRKNFSYSQLFGACGAMPYHTSAMIETSDVIIIPYDFSEDDIVKCYAIDYEGNVKLVEYSFEQFMEMDMSINYSKKNDE